MPATAPRKSEAMRWTSCFCHAFINDSTTSAVDPSAYYMTVDMLLNMRSSAKTSPVMIESNIIDANRE